MRLPSPAPPAPPPPRPSTSAELHAATGRAPRQCSPAAGPPALRALVRRRRRGSGGGALAASVGPAPAGDEDTAIVRPPVRLAGLRARQDVLEPDVRLRQRRAPMPNTWSDGLPYVPDEDLICLRVVHHGRFNALGWASAGAPLCDARLLRGAHASLTRAAPHAGGCQYDDDGCLAVYGPHGEDVDPDGATQEELALQQAVRERALEPDDDYAAPEPPPGGAAPGMPPLPASWAVRGGPRDTIYFDPAAVRAAIVTVGGLCPGLNDVVRALVQALEAYGVPRGNTLGIRYGFRGFFSADHPPVVLTCDTVDSIHLSGGTVLGTSRGGSDVRRIADAIGDLRLDFVFVVGGNGGNAAVDAIHRECMERGLAVAVVGLPKSIDNDILLIDSCFGFNTAVGEAVRAVLAANVEARSAHHGVGLVKLMGRSSGFIAAQASVASGDVDVCLVPEAPFQLERVIEYIYAKLRSRGHCTVVVAEGAAQEVMRAEMAALGAALPAETDASGNPVLLDVGRWLKGKIKAAGGKHSVHPDDDGAEPVTPDIKYIEPAYQIRSVPAGTVDKVYCRMLSHSAVHGAFAGYSGFTAGLASQHYVYLPAAEVVRSTRRLDPRGRLYRMMRAALQQPDFSE